MKRSLDLTSKIFGRLRVTRSLGRRFSASRKSSSLYWECLCECGKVKEIAQEALVRGRTVSCGCFHKDATSAASFIDLSNQKFNKLTVLGISDKIGKGGSRYWKCLCDCGNIADVSTAALKGDYTKSCGCLARDKSMLQVDHAGKKYNKLEIISRDPLNGNKWLCKCDCGNTISSYVSPLLRGRTKSCGCYRKNIKTKHGLSDSTKYKVFQSRNHRERKKLFDSSWTFDMDKKTREFFPVCVICKTPIDLEVDHLLPVDLGYGLFLDNVTVLCAPCNGSKGNKYIADLPPEIRRKLIDASCEFQDYLEWQMYAEPVNV